MKWRGSRIHRIDYSSGTHAGNVPAGPASDGDSLFVRLSSPPGTFAADADVAGVRALARACARQRLALLLELRLDQLAVGTAIAHEHPHWFRRAGGTMAGPLDPRQPAPTRELSARFDLAEATTGLGAWYEDELAALLDAGLAGFVVHWPQNLPAPFTHDLFAALRAHRRDAAFVAWTPGATGAQRRALAGGGYDACVCSLAWWDWRAPWFGEEIADLRRIGRVLAPVSPADGGDREHDARALRRAEAWAQACADGMIFEDGDSAAPARATTAAATARSSAAPAPAQSRSIGAPWARVGAWLDSARAQLVLVNSDLDHHAVASARALAALAAIDAAALADVDALAPGEVRILALPDAKPIEQSSAALPLAQARAAARVAIENVTPDVDDGRFAAKSTVGETVVVGADVFTDGHPTLAVHLLWREQGAADWQRVRMRSIGNDRWTGDFATARLGRHEFAVEAGIDEFATFRTDLAKKLAAGQAGELDAAEGRLLVERAARRAPPELRKPMRDLARAIGADDDPIARLLAPDCADLVNAALPPAFAVQSGIRTVLCERRIARCAAWYELFPRSQAAGGRHGTFADVIAQLPRIAAMGFDVLYFPPIHPIGESKRKGANNAPAAQPGEPGSAYAIGGEAGGHDALHPQLGTLADFRKLVAAAAEHGLEIALDFAVQCSPDHPWISEHPEWFDWRPDGSLKHAENPPKKYEDIVNVDFYARKGAEALWRALRDVVAFWLRHGVRTFRVDNPHTKPLPFWEWLIAEMRALDPGVVFLSEAFTRPRMMYRLAKLGFSQSYTYFTWRNTRAELEAYLRELNAPPVDAFFRPHFFVNTPDINPYYLQTSGRPGFLIRAALAATLSGLWGLYSGFELCESAPLPGREEYLDSEKYQLRERDWNGPGNIVAEITQLNRIRRANPALHSHLGLTFHACSNPNVLYFAKATPARDNTVLVAICLDPHHAQEAEVELPLWEFGLDDNAALQAEDLLRGDEFAWRGKIQRLRLDPATTPYRIWRLRREETLA